MKVDKAKIRYTTELPPDCKVVIERLKKSSRIELVQYLREFQLWNLSKSELAYWSVILDMFDGILEECCQAVNSNVWCLSCDKFENAELRETACCVLNFMALLIEHTFGRHIFSSIDRIILLLNTSDVSLLNATLSLLYSFSKRSSFIQRLDAEVHGVLMKKMNSISESWGERENGFSLADCCRHISAQNFPRNPLSFSFEYYFISENVDQSTKSKKSTAPSQLACLRCDLSELSFVSSSTGEVMVKLLNEHRIPEVRHQQLFHRLRLARGFAEYNTRLQLIESRLLTLTTLIYCRTVSPSAITATFIEEVAELLQLSPSIVPKEHSFRLSQLKGAALKLLTALVHAELNGYKKLGTIVDCLGVNDYHGFLPSLFRQTVQSLIDEKKTGEGGELSRPNGFTTCIFSLLYHMATIEPTGSGALLAAGLVEPLLKVVGWYSPTEENLAYVTRAVRVVNLICDYDATSFFQLGGLGICVQRLEHDVEVCRREQPYEIQAEWLQSYMEPVQVGEQQQQQASDNNSSVGEASSPTSASFPKTMEVVPPKSDPILHKSTECSQQRMALLKSLLGFFKDLFANQTHADQIRRVMDAAVPRCLRHIISNPQYYGPTVFLNAIDLVTRYIYQEPSLLSQLQDSGFTNVVLYALIIRDVPATREVLAQLPAAFSALCLNQRGLETFIHCKPFDRLMKFLFSPEYLPAMQRRTGGKDAGGNSDTARSLGLAVDDMMRHQPALRPNTMRALVKLLEQLGAMGRDKNAAWAGVISADSTTAPTTNGSTAMFHQQATDDGGSTSDDDEGVNLPLAVVGVGLNSSAGTTAVAAANNQPAPSVNAATSDTTSGSANGTPPTNSTTTGATTEPTRRKPPVTEFIYNTMRFMEAMLSSNATDDHCTAFSSQGGVEPLLSLLTLPHLPLDFAGYHACDSVAAVVKSMIGLSRNGQLVTKTFEILEKLLRSPVLSNFSNNGLQQTSSSLWAEASRARTEEDLSDPAVAPLIRALSAVHATVSMLFHLSSNQQEVRAALLNSWGSPEGIPIFVQLSQLYTALIWEFSLLVLEADTVVSDYQQQAQTAAAAASAASDNSDKMETTGSSSSPPAVAASTPTVSGPAADRVKLYKFVAGLVADQLKAFHQLFIHLVRLAAATPSRRTRLGMMVPPVSSASHFLAATGCKAIHTALSATLPPSADTRAKLKYYQIAAGTLTWLYDDNNQPYHILLCFFSPVGCRDALKSVIEYLLTLDPTTVHPPASLPSLPGATAPNRPSLPTLMTISVDNTLSELLTEFRRLCSTSVIVDSPNSLQSPGSSGGFLPGVSSVAQRAGGGTGLEFDANAFVANMQSVAFSLLQKAWSPSAQRIPTSPISPLLVDIMCHVLSSPQLAERSGADEEKAAASSSGPSAPTTTASSSTNASSATGAAGSRETAGTSLEPPVSADHLQQLCDMGFPRELAIDALLNTTNLEQAADYCLTHPAPPPAVAQTMVPPESSEPSSAEPTAQPSTTTSQSISTISRPLSSGSDLLDYMMASMPQLPRAMLVPPGSSVDANGQIAPPEPLQVKPVPELINSSDVNNFLSKIFNDLLLFAESNQLIIPKVAALLSSAIRAKPDVSGPVLFTMLLDSTVQLIDDSNVMASQDGQKRLAARLYLSSLLLTGVKVLVDCSVARALANRLVALLANTEIDASTKPLPVWIAPAVCYIDVYIESAVGSYLRSFTLRVIEKPHRWQWYKSEDRQPKWIDYPPAECRLLDAAYKRGQPTVRLHVSSRSVVGGPPQPGNRRSYTVDLRKMRQVADDSGTGRRIRIATSYNKPTSPSKEMTSSSDFATMEVDETSMGSAREFDFAINEKFRLIEFCVRMLGIDDTEGNCHQAVLLLLARLTSEAALCSHFVLCGGLKSLFQLQATPTVMSLSSVIMLLLRHVLEDTTTIRAMMERLCRTLVGQPTERDREREMMLGHMPAGSQSQTGTKEFHYFVQLMAPLICKNMDLWQEVCENVVRLQASHNNKADDDERLGTTAVYCRLAAHLQQASSSPQAATNSNSHQPPNSINTTTTTTTTTNTSTTGNSLASTNSLPPGHQQVPVNESATAMIKMLLGLVCQNDEDEEDEPNQPPVASGNGKHQQQPAVVDKKTEQTEATAEAGKSDAQEATTPPKRTRLFSKNFVLRALAELVRASPSVSLLVVHYQHQPVLLNVSDAHDSSPTALSMIFDDFLTRPTISNAASRLVAALAACYQCPDAQSGLVNEAKLALGRALAKHESPSKHRHLRCLAEVVQLMIQVCPSQQQTPLPSSFRVSDKHQQMNNIIRLMYKRGLVADLAKASHSLDLSSPELPGTINALLTPLDTLCHAVNTQHLQQQLQSQHAQRHHAANSRNEQQQQQGAGHGHRQRHTGHEAAPHPAATTTITAGNVNTVNTAQAMPVTLETTATTAGATATTTTVTNTGPNAAVQPTASAAGGAVTAQSDAELEESLGPVSLPADEPTMEHILERLLNDNHSGDIHDLLGVAPVNIAGNRGRRHRHHHHQLVVLEDLSSEDDGDDGEDDDDGDGENDNAVNVNLDGGVSDTGANDSQSRDVANAGGRSGSEVGTGLMEVGEVDDDFETADDDDDDDNDDGDMGDADDDGDDDGVMEEGEEGVMEEGEEEEDDDDYGDDQESGATEAISDEAGDHVHGVIPGDIDIMLGTLPTDDTPTLPPVATTVVTNGLGAGVALPSAGSGNVFAHPLLSRAAVAPTHQHRSNFANAIAGAAGSVGIFPGGGAGGGGGFRHPRSVGIFPRHRQNASLGPGGLQAMVFEELNADFFRHIFGDLLGGDDLDLRTGLGGNHFDQIFADTGNRRHGIFLGGGPGRVRGEGLFQDGLSAGGWQTVGGIDLNGRFDSPSAAIADVPSTLQRWSEEARLLYGGNVHDMTLAADRRLYGILCRVREKDIREQQEQQQKLQQQQQEEQQKLAQEQQQKEQQLKDQQAAALGNGASSEPVSMTAEISGTVAAGTAAPTSGVDAQAVAADVDSGQVARAGDIVERMDATETVSSSSSSRAIETPVIVHPGQQNMLSLDEMQTLASLMTFGDTSQPESSVSAVRPAEGDISEPSVLSSSMGQQPMEAETAPSMASSNALPMSSSESISPGRQMEVSTSVPSEEAVIELREESIEPTAVVESITAAASGPTDLSTGARTEQNTGSAPPTTGEAAGTAAAANSNVPAAAAAAVAAPDSGAPLGLEGIDPSFLEALPDNIRQEVIAEQIRLQSMRRALQESRDAFQRLGVPQDQVAEISPEFLAALPPQIQEEIVAAQQAERARLLDEQQRTANANAGAAAATTGSTDVTESAGAATTTGAAAATGAAAGTSSGTTQEGIDPATFLATLPANLRQQVLADMDDSLVNILPTDLATEARRLRQEAEERQARVFQQRLNDFPGGLDFVYSLRPSGVTRGRFAAFRPSLPMGGRSGRGFSMQPRDAAAEARAAAAESAVRQLLDHEGLACLIILLFVTDSRTYAQKLKSLLLRLCQHKPTRIWIIDTIMSILRRAAETQQLGEHQKIPNINDGGWLNVGMESALGGRTRVFQLPQMAGKRASSYSPTIGIHPQAATTVCRQALDILQALAKHFPSQFVQPTISPPITDGVQVLSQQQAESDFWEVLLKLDNPQSASAMSVTPSTPSKRGRLRGGASESGGQGVSASSVSSSSGVASTPLAALMALLGGSNIRKSQQLTDKVLTLMNMVCQLPNLPTMIKECHRAGEPKEMKTTLSVTLEEQQQPKESDQPIIPKLLPLVIDAMIGKACSEEGLEDATSLLGHLSLVNQPTWEFVKKLLIGASSDVGCVVCLNVRSLLGDIDRVCPPPPPGEADMTPAASGSAAASSHMAGRLTDRYTGSEVVVSAPKKAVVLPADLQLPSVSLFTSRTSSQRYLLRILKAIRQLQQQNQTSAARQNSTVAATSAASGEQSSSAAASASSEIGQAPLLAEKVGLDELWLALSDCLTRLELSADPQAVLLLQPAVEAFFIVHSKPPERSVSQATSGTQQRAGGTEAAETAPATQHIVPPEPLATTPVTAQQPALPPEQQLFVHFAEKHRVVLNQILRQSTQPLSEGPFAVLANYTRILDFDVKRRYFRQELERMDEGRRRDDLAVHVRRLHVFEDSYRELHRRVPEEWKARFFVIFDGEEGQDAGGLLREWFVILSREIFNPHYALFRTSPGDRVTYSINELSSCHLEHLSYFKFVGQLIAKAIYENKLLDCYFTRSFYKHILGIPVKYTDMESEDYTLYRNLVYLLEHNAAELELDLTFSAEIPQFGVMNVRDLKPNGRDLPVTEENKREYVQLLCQMKMTGAIEQQLESFLDGFYSIIPRRLISIFNEQELELLICGLPTVDIEDLRVNTEIHKYQLQSLQIQWLWRALRSFSDSDRARFMQFVTGTSKVPLGGFANLEGMHGAQKFQIHRDDRSTERLPTAHTCFNQLDLPPYETYDKLRQMLLIAITEGSEGFGFA